VLKALKLRRIRRKWKERGRFSEIGDASSAANASKLLQFALQKCSPINNSILNKYMQEATEYPLLNAPHLDADLSMVHPNLNPETGPQIKYANIIPFKKAPKITRSLNAQDYSSPLSSPLCLTPCPSPSDSLPCASAKAANSQLPPPRAEE
jgi:hypothetical protein